MRRSIKNNTMKNALLVLLCIVACFGNILMAQNQQDYRLANQYYQKGEYEKAASLYKKVYEASSQSTHYYRQYFKCLIAIEDLETAEKLVKKRTKKYRSDVTLLVDMGVLYRTQERYEDAEKQFDKALQTVQVNHIRNLASTFNQANELGYAMNTYLKGRKMQNDEKAYAYDLARIYEQQGDIQGLIFSYVDYATLNERYVQTAKIRLQKLLDSDERMEILQTELYRRIQNSTEELVYPELLIWSFIQQKDYESALVQCQALDRRLGDEGDRIMNLAEAAFAEGEYDTSIGAYQYLIDKGVDSRLYMPSKIALLQTQFGKITQSDKYTTSDITSLRDNYNSFLEEFGRNPNSVTTMRDLSHLYAYYIYDLDNASDLLHEILDMPAASGHQKALSKLDLGDYYLMKGEVWESTLFYSQVDKAYQDDILGEEARFRNAKLSYYNGDFDWAQSQLDVLKAATSELIANDAIEMSVFITDNMGLDTTTATMEMFARADLLLVQNKEADAFTVFDSINSQYPKHYLADDILFAKAKQKIKNRAYTDAAADLEVILKDFNEDLLADDALFNLAQLNELYFDQTELAMEMYQEILLNHPSSLYVVESRKRYRKLRGDILN
ncbi:MAG: tetratricopeptide repeat protein [Chitinophagales bacterium]